MPQSPQDVMQDPKFLSLSPDAQRIVLGKMDPKFAAMSPDAQGLVLQRLGHATQQAQQLHTPEQPWYKRAWDFITQPIGTTAMDVPAGMVPHMPNLGGGGQVGAYKQAQGNPTPRQMLTGYAQAPPTIEESKSPTKTGIKKGLAHAATDVSDTAMAAYSPAGLATTPVATMAATPGAVGTVGRLAQIGMGSTFAGAGTGDIIQAGLSNTPEAWQQRLQGGSMVTGGTGGALALPPVPPGSESTINIGGVEIPQTRGQMAKPGLIGSFTKSMEHYLSGTPVGEPLKQIRMLQEARAREVVNKLSGVSEPVPNEIAQNWARSAQETRLSASPYYDSIKDVPTPSVAGIAQELLADESLRLSPKARTALENAAGTGSETAVAKSLGYKTVAEARNKIGPVFDDILAKDQAATGQTATGANALAARSEIGDMMRTAKDPRDRMRLRDAWEDINDAINSHLTPDQIAAKQQGDLLWRRSYIQDRIADKLETMERPQNPADASKVLVGSFVKIVNDLSRQKFSRRGGEVVGVPTDMERLFNNPADRKAMTDLAGFLATKYSNFHGAAGLSESMARLGITLEGMRIPMELATGKVGVGVKAAAWMGGLMGLSKVLANPGGSRMALTYLRAAPGSAAAANAAAVIGSALGGTPVANPSTALVTPSKLEDRYPTAQSIMLGMKSGDLSQPEGALLLQRLRRSASTGQTRRLSQPEAPPTPTIPQ